jgi:hypothetical protein
VRLPAGWARQARCGCCSGGRKRHGLLRKHDRWDELLQRGRPLQEHSKLQQRLVLPLSDLCRRRGMLRRATTRVWEGGPHLEYAFVQRGRAAAGTGARIVRRC